jgi:hypothetical protein
MELHPAVAPSHRHPQRPVHPLPVPPPHAQTHQGPPPDPRTALSLALSLALALALAVAVAGRGIQPPKHSLILPILRPRHIPTAATASPPTNTQQIKFLRSREVRNAALARYAQARARASRPPKLFEVLLLEPGGICIAGVFSVNIFIFIFINRKPPSRRLRARTGKESRRTVCPC